MEGLLYLRLVSRFIGLDSTKQEDSCYLHVVTRLKQIQSNGGPAVQWYFPLRWVFSGTSVTRLGYFWKVFEAYSLTKLTQILDNFLCYFENLSSNCFGSFWAPLVKIWLLLIRASGHTVWYNNVCGHKSYAFLAYARAARVTFAWRVWSSLPRQP